MNQAIFAAMGSALVFILPAVLFEVALSCAIAGLYMTVIFRNPATDNVITVNFARRAWLFMMAGTFGGVLGSLYGREPRFNWRLYH